MSVTVTVLFPTREEESEPFYTMLIAALAETRVFDGCVNVTTHRDLDDPSKIFLIEEWKSREDQQKYLAWRQETGFVEAIGPMLAGAPVINAYSNTGD
jgi:quinol monooxygenase YgiN